MSDEASVHLWENTRSPWIRIHVYFGGTTLRALKKIVEGNQLIHLDASLPRFFLSYCFNLQCSAICSAAGWCLNQPNAGFYKPRIVQHTQQLQEIFS